MNSSSKVNTIKTSTVPCSWEDVSIDFLFEHAYRSCEFENLAISIACTYLFKYNLIFIVLVRNLRESRHLLHCQTTWQMRWRQLVSPWRVQRVLWEVAHSSRRISIVNETSEIPIPMCTYMLNVWLALRIKILNTLWLYLGPAGCNSVSH